MVKAKKVDGSKRQNVPSWQVVECSKCHKKLKNAKKPFIKGPGIDDEIFCDKCRGYYFAHYFPPGYFKKKTVLRTKNWNKRIGLPPYNPSARRDDLNGN